MTAAARARSTDTKILSLRVHVTPRAERKAIVELIDLPDGPTLRIAVKM